MRVHKLIFLEGDLCTMAKIFNNVDSLIEGISDNNIVKQRQKNHKGEFEVVEYYNIPSAFDIETSSFIYKGQKVGLMYEWTFGILDRLIVGRTWNEFIDMMKEIVSKLKLSITKRLVVYIHNISFEFQFIRKHFEWDRIFAMKKHEPVYAITKDGIEFRCSYLLTGMSLKNVAKNLMNEKLEKKVGQLDYSKIRHSQTPLTPEEWEYCYEDVLIVLALIREKIEQDGSIVSIPLTVTGYVRKHCQKVFYDKKSSSYQKLIKNLTLEEKEYLQLKRGYQGGFVHANAWRANQTY